jgi:hypothetical protein
VELAHPMAMAPMNIEAAPRPAATVMIGESYGSWCSGASRCALILLVLVACLSLGMLITSSPGAKVERMFSRTSKDYVTAATQERHYSSNQLSSPLHRVTLPPYSPAAAGSLCSGIPPQRHQEPNPSELGRKRLHRLSGGRGGSNLWSLRQRDHAWEAYVWSRNEKIV